MEDDTIIVVGGFDSSAHTGEIVKSKFTLAVMADTYCKIYKTLKHIANGDWSQAGRSFPFKMVDGEPVPFPSIRVNSS